MAETESLSEGIFFLSLTYQTLVIIPTLFLLFGWGKISLIQSLHIFIKLNYTFISISLSLLVSGTSFILARDTTSPTQNYMDYNRKQG